MFLILELCFNVSQKLLIKIIFYKKYTISFGAWKYRLFQISDSCKILGFLLFFEIFET